MKKANTYRFNIQFRAVTGDQIQVGEFLSSLGRLKSTCIIEAVKQYMMAHPEIAAAALVKVGSPASSGVSPLNAAPPSPPKAACDMEGQDGDIMRKTMPFAIFWILKIGRAHV